MHKTDQDLKVRSISGILFVAIAMLIAFILTRCAHQGSLAGGPKDILPPIALKATPPDHTILFTAKKVTITFNEFIQLKDPSKEIFISPPMGTKPEFKVQGKDLVVDFQEELKANSTYTINFGNAIADFTEGNVLQNFEYVFSTGEIIDSLWIQGRILNAFNLKPEANIIAMVYTNDNDTLPLDSLPLHVAPKSASRTDKEGNFRINNLAAGSYKLIGLEDLNNNYYYDLPNERIAFLDSMIVLNPPETDTVNDIQADSSILAEEIVQIPDVATYTIYLFQSSDPRQKFLGKKHFGALRLQYAFRMPVDTFSATLVNYTPENPDWYMPEYSRKRDTVDLWLRPGLPDTIKVRMFAGDSIIDTSRFILSQLEKTSRSKKDETKTLNFLPNTYAATLNLNQELKFVFASPVLRFDTSRILLKSASDSLSPSLSFDNDIQRIVTVHHSWKPGEAYRITVADSAFIDQRGIVNDSTIIGFKVRAPEDYGLLILSVEVPSGDSCQYIIQLMDTKETVLSEKPVRKSSLIRFEYLLPGKYLVKAIFDRNFDGIWDPGNYRKALLPEKVQYYPKQIEIRANWDLQEDWKLE